jgi:hypothetical protein
VRRGAWDLVMGALFDDEAARGNHFADEVSETIDGAIAVPGNVFE